MLTLKKLGLITPPPPPQYPPRYGPVYANALIEGMHDANLLWSYFVRGKISTRSCTFHRSISKRDRCRRPVWTTPIQGVSKYSRKSPRSSSVSGSDEVTNSSNASITLSGGTNARAWNFFIQNALSACPLYH